MKKKNHNSFSGFSVFRIIVASAATVAVFALLVFARNDQQKKGFVNIPIITLAELLQSMQKTNTAIIDVREESFYRYGHIVSAVNIPASELENISDFKVSSLKKSAEIIVYCGNSGCGTSFFAARKLIDRGLNNVEVYADGWGEWQSCGLPITSAK